MSPRLWGRASSVNVQKVMWLLAELEISHERIDAGWTYGRNDTPEFRAMNPTGQIPVWQEDDDFALAESHAILRHLARENDQWWPRDPRARARVDQWMEFAGTSLLPRLAKVFYAKVRLDPASFTAAQLAGWQADLDGVLDLMETHLTDRDALAAPHLTIADVAAGTQMFRVFDLDIPRKPRPALERWYAVMRARPAYRDSAMTSYAELRFKSD